MLRLREDSPKMKKVEALMAEAEKLGLRLDVRFGYLTVSFEDGTTYDLADGEDSSQAVCFPPECEFKLVRDED